MKRQDTYAEPSVSQSEGWRVRVYRPILTDDERARRMKRIAAAASDVLIAQYKLEKGVKNYGI